MLTENQTEWIFLRAKRLTDKYIKMFPMNDMKWELFVQDIKNLEEKARGDELMRILLLAIGDYLKKQEKEM